jgi:hypothetical protein
MHRIADCFEVVIWRSMRDLSKGEELLKGLLQVFHPQSLNGAPTSRLQRQDILLEQMRAARVLLVLDNFEAVLEAGEGAGRMRPGFEPLDAASCYRLLSEKALIGSAPEQMRLIEAYSGNPSALKIAANTIVNLFDGEIAPFLEKGEVIIGGVRGLLEEQFRRLSSLEQSLLLWLAILREPTTIVKLLAAWAAPVSRARLLEALDALYHRSLIERGFQPHEFVLPSLVKEYLTTWLITHVTAEDQQEKLERLIEHSLEPAPAGEDVRQPRNV